MRAMTLKALARLLTFLLIMAGSLLISAGRLDWVMAWVLVGILAVGIVVNVLVLVRKNPELIDERTHIRKGVKAWDKVLAPVVAVLGPLAIWSVAGLDVRFRWSPRVPLVLQLVGLAFLVLGYCLTSWAMASNKFFSSLVRIQEERGHTVVSAGPYRSVRHPGYVGAIIFDFAAPVMLGCLWALVPAGLTVGVIILRTALEDRTLQHELQGYNAYAQEVRYRLLPGVW